MTGYLKILLALVFVFFSSGIYAQDTKVQEAKKARLEREIAIIDKQLAENASKSSATLSNLELIRKKISNRKDLIAESDREIRTISNNINNKQNQINTLQDRIDTLKSHYSRLILSAYKNRDSKVWYMYILASENLGQAFRRYSYFKNLSNQINEEAKTIRAMQEDLIKEKEALAVMKKEAQRVKAERVKELEKLNKEEAEAEKLVQELKQNEATYKKQLENKKRQINALNKEIERIVAAAMKKKSKKSKRKLSAEEIKLSEEFSSNKGILPWPADGPIVGRYGKQFHPVFRNLELPPNNGIDIALSRDTEIRTIFNGVVKQVFVMPGYNQCVLIQHGNYFTFYCKLKSVKVKAGAKVKTGEIIGIVDTINGETQLHFEVWMETKPQNPEGWLR